MRREENYVGRTAMDMIVYIKGGGRREDIREEYWTQ